MIRIEFISLLVLSLLCLQIGCKQDSPNQELKTENERLKKELANLKQFSKPKVSEVSGQSKSKEPNLTQLLKSPLAGERVAACVTIAENDVKNSELIHPLLNCLSDKEKGKFKRKSGPKGDIEHEISVATVAKKALVSFGDDAIPHLVDAIRSEQNSSGLREFSKSCVQVLGTISGPRSFDALAKMLRSNEFAKDHLTIVFVISESGKDKAVRHLVEQLDSKNQPKSNIRGQASNELRQIGNKEAVTALKSAVLRVPTLPG